MHLRISSAAPIRTHYIHADTTQLNEFTSRDAGWLETSVADLRDGEIMCVEMRDDEARNAFLREWLVVCGGEAAAMYLDPTFPT